ncbi:L-serine ammonia-lyase [bacterium]|nr:L-serine ammonia-lyase [bacterium]
MQSIRHLYRIGTGPSSSHTMGPKRAAEQFLNENIDAHAFHVTLFRSLASTGKGHLTDVALAEVFSGRDFKITWKPDEDLPEHPNGMRFEALDASKNVITMWEVYSIGGGALSSDITDEADRCTYPFSSMEAILKHCESSGQAMWEIVNEHEDASFWSYLEKVWVVMKEAIQRGVVTEGVLPGGLGVSRKAWAFLRKARLSSEYFKHGGIVSAYALAVAEENAANGIIVTAPTCGSCGTLPAVLKHIQETTDCSDKAIHRALATAGLIGNLIQHNASISGAEVGCQGEIGSASAMAAGAAVHLLGGTVQEVEYAAEMGLEHHLGLTCDPVAGLVQIPCIERNAFAARRALACADYAIFAGGNHRISFDEVVNVMQETGCALPSLYRETSEGGLAAAYRKRALK